RDHVRARALPDVQQAVVGEGTFDRASRTYSANVVVSAYLTGVGPRACPMGRRGVATPGTHARRVAEMS
ncbi:hypothetical protein AB0B67_23450, partial [Streptomyces spectabilis]